MYSIYKLTDLDTGRVYIGSTKQKLSRRLSIHRHFSKTGKGCTCKDFNWNNVEIEEIELVEVDHFQRERYYIQNTDCVNKNRPARTEEERKEQIKEYDEKHKEQRKEYRKEYRKQKITCECGSIITRGALARHKISTKHQEFLQK